MHDVTVFGAGIFGLSIAWDCVRRGASVHVIDPGGAGAGASGGILGALAPHVPENWNVKKAFQLESLLLAEPFWREVEEVSGLSSGYTRSGRVQPIADAAALALAKARVETAQVLWGPHATWQITQTPPVWHPPSPMGQWIYDDLSAHLHPRRAIRALAGALAAKGVEVHPQAPVQSPPQGAVVWATGVAGLEDLNRALERPIGTGVKGQAALLKPHAPLPPNAPQLFAETLHIIPHQDGTIALGSTSETDFTDPQSTDAQLDALIAHAVQLVPALAGADVIERWAGLRPRAKSRAPILGPHPTQPGHFIANGGFKIGFGMAPKIAQTMGDLILEGKDHVPEAFRV